MPKQTPTDNQGKLNDDIPSQLTKNLLTAPISGAESFK